MPIADRRADARRTPLHLWDVAALAAFALYLAAARPDVVQGQELSPRETGWDGLSELAAIARGASTRVEVPPAIDVSKLHANDALLIVHPTRPLPVPALAAFVRAGGRLAIADDFGTSDRLLRAFHIERDASTRPGHAGAALLRGNAELPIALPRSGHPLAQGVHALVLNHAAQLHHGGLAPVFSTRAGAGAVVLTGVVGDGRLVAIADGSVLINNMLELQGNRRFAENLVRYLATAEGALYLAAAASQLTGAAPALRDDPRGNLEARLQQVARLPLPSSAIVALCIVLGCAILAVAATALPRAPARQRRAFVELPACIAGFDGRVRAYASGRHGFVAPLACLKAELERAVPRAALDTVDDARALLRALDALERAQHAGGASVSARKFVELTARGRRILARLPASHGT